MSPKKIEKKNKGKIIDIKTLVSKKLSLNKLKLNPTNVITDTKNKIGGFYINLKKEREKEKKRLEKKKILDEKKNYREKRNNYKKKN